MIIVRKCLARRIYIENGGSQTRSTKSPVHCLFRSDDVHDDADHIQTFAVKSLRDSRIRGLITKRVHLDNGKAGTLVCVSSTSFARLSDKDEDLLIELTKGIDDIYYRRQEQHYQSLRSHLALLNGLVLSLRNSLCDVNKAGHEIVHHWEYLKSLFLCNDPIKTPRRRQSHLITLAVTEIDRALKLMKDRSDTCCNVIERTVMVAKGFLTKNPATYMRSCGVTEQRGFVSTLNEYLNRFSATLPRNMLLWTFRTENFFSTCSHVTYYHHLLLFLENVIFHWSAICSTIQLSIVFEDCDAASVFPNAQRDADYAAQPFAYDEREQCWKASDREGFDHRLVGNIVMTLLFSDEFEEEEMSFPMEIISQILSLLNSSLSRLSRESVVQIAAVQSTFQPDAEDAYVIRVPCTMYFTEEMYEQYEHHRRMKQQLKVHHHDNNTFRLTVDTNTGGHPTAPSHHSHATVVPHPNPSGPTTADEKRAKYNAAGTPRYVRPAQGAASSSSSAHGAGTTGNHHQQHHSTTDKTHSPYEYCVRVVRNWWTRHFRPQHQHAQPSSLRVASQRHTPPSSKRLPVMTNEHSGNGADLVPSGRSQGNASSQRGTLADAECSIRESQKQRSRRQSSQRQAASQRTSQRTSQRSSQGSSRRSSKKKTPNIPQPTLWDQLTPLSPTDNTADHVPPHRTSAPASTGVAHLLLGWLPNRRVKPSTAR